MARHAHSHSHESSTPKVTMTKKGNRYEFRCTGSDAVKEYALPDGQPIGDLAQVEARLQAKAEAFFAKESK